MKRKNEEKLEEEKIIKDIRNLLRLEKEQNYNAIKGIRTFLDKKKETRAIKDRILRDIKNLLSMKKKKKITINR